MTQEHEEFDQTRFSRTYSLKPHKIERSSPELSPTFNRKKNEK